MNRTLVVSMLSALVGGVVVAIAVVALGVGGDGGTTTVVQQAPLSKPVSNGPAKGLTANEIYKRDAPGVVHIRSHIVQRSQSPFGLSPQTEQGEATGSGFVVDDQGTILTNAHVIDGATKVTVTSAEDKTAEARIVGKDTSTDLAVLKVDPKGLGLEPLELGDSSTLQVGDPTIAIGNPFGLDRTLTTGVVSALQRQISAPDGFTIRDVIQTDAAINPGNSGGPLLDGAGRVIGINSQIATGGGGNDGIAFAVPINTAKRILPQLKAEGRVQRAFLGITGADIDEQLKSLNLGVDRGVLVQEVTPDGPAQKAGVKGGDTQAEIGGQPFTLGGDIITKVDGKQVQDMEQVIAIVDGKKPGEKVELEVVRDGKSSSVEVQLGKRPSTTPIQ